VLPDIAGLTVNIYCNRLIQKSLNRKFVMTVRSWSKGFAGKLTFGCRAALMAVLLFAAPSLMALGLGEITLNSSLNEPLNADIVVLSSEDLEDGQLLVSLASPEAFERAGISRDFFYSQMQFSISRDSADLHIIKIITKQPVDEPYLNFLIQLQWPAGRVMREYTLLLDLPIFTGQQQEQSVTPAAVQSPTAPVGNRSGSAAAAKTLAPYLEPLSGDDHQVIVGDTLWNVAKRLRPQNTTILQTMDSLYRHNGDAFVEGDANRIKAGSVLRLPSFDEISLEAGNTVAAQIGLKNPAIASTELERALEQANGAAANDRPVYQRSQPAADDGRLELASAFGEEPAAADDAISDQPLTASEIDSQTAYADTNQVNLLADELAVANDEVNKAQQENRELRERLALLEAQVATMVALLEQAEKAPATTAVPVAAQISSGDIKSQDLNQNQTLAQQLSAVPAYFWLIIIAIILVLLVLLARKSSQQQASKARSDDLSMAAGYEKYDDSSAVAASSPNELHALDDLELDPEDNLFDESDTDIFDSDEEPINDEVFDMTVEAVAEADVYLSLGKTAEAIEVLEEARAEDSTDASSRLKLMEVLFRENRKDELRVLFDEIEATGDQSAAEMAAIIIGPDSQSEKVAPIAEDALAAELEGLDFQSTEFEDLGLGSIDLADLELDDIDAEGITFEGAELEDLDLENLTADDFDIEPADEEPEVEPESELESELESEPEPSSASQTEEPEDSSLTSADNLMDDFADFDEGSEQSAVDVKLDLAKTYLEMGDPEGAKEILEELIEESDEEGQQKARALLETV
jgi:pilus assembly protein FimV